MRRQGDINLMGDHKLSRIVLSCIEDDSKERPSAREIVGWLQQERRKIQQKKRIALTAGLALSLKIVAIGGSGSGKITFNLRFVRNSGTEFDDPTNDNSNPRSTVGL